MDELKNSKIMHFGTAQEANLHSALINAEYHCKKEFISLINNSLNEFFKEAYLQGYEQAKKDLKEDKKQESELK